MAESLAAWEGIEAERSRSMSKLRAALQRSSAELQAAKAERSQEAEKSQSLAQQLQDSRLQVPAQGLGFRGGGVRVSGGRGARAWCSSCRAPSSRGSLRVSGF